MISIFPFELKKLLQRKAALGAFIIFLLAIFGLFYQHFLLGKLVAILQIKYMVEKRLPLIVE
ncbi:TPA: hypothetical protein VAZ94_000064 [Streptococcus agalactiae]|nr:hypothetical protein [Streptococcus agalactiae]